MLITEILIELVKINMKNKKNVTKTTNIFNQGMTNFGTNICG